MASETEPETTYKEAPFADENREEIPVKVHIVAPGTLPEGYVFDAEVGPPGDKKTISVEVVSLLLSSHRWLLFLYLWLSSCAVRGNHQEEVCLCALLCLMSNNAIACIYISPQFFSRITPPIILSIQPPGGVVEGQIFLSALPPGFGDGEPQVNIPTGHWKDGLFDCFNAGIFHPSLWCAFCFTQGEIYFAIRLHYFFAYVLHI